MQKELVVSIAQTKYSKVVFEAGADAICLHYRSMEQQFGEEFLQELDKQIEYAHSISRKLYFALDFFAHNEDIRMLKDLLLLFGKQLEHKPDAIIVYDPGAFNMVKKLLPQVAIHIGSTMNVTNDSVCDIWSRLGASRIELAHVLTADAVETIAQNYLATAEIEAFLYGVPCISYSGRSLLDGFLEECGSQKEQVQYLVMEEQRQGDYYAVEQDNRGTYIFDAKTRDWSMEVGRLARAGVSAFHIEGMLYGEAQLTEAVDLCKRALDAITI